MAIAGPSTPSSTGTGSAAPVDPPQLRASAPTRRTGDADTPSATSCTLAGVPEPDDGSPGAPQRPRRPAAGAGAFGRGRDLVEVVVVLKRSDVNPAVDVFGALRAADRTYHTGSCEGPGDRHGAGAHTGVDSEHVVGPGDLLAVPIRSALTYEATTVAVRL